MVSTVSCNTALELCGAFADVVRTRIGSPYGDGKAAGRIVERLRRDLA